MGFTGQAGDDSYIPVYYFKLIVFTILPLVLALVNLIVWLLINTVKGRDYTKLRSEF